MASRSTIRGAGGIKVNTTLQLLWSTTGLSKGIDATFTAYGHVAVSDAHPSQSNVVMFNKKGELIGRDEGIPWFHWPCGIAYHNRQAALVVADRIDGCLGILNGKNCSIRKKVRLPDHEDEFDDTADPAPGNPTGVAIMSDDRIVVTTRQMGPGPGKIIIYKWDGGDDLQYVNSWADPTKPYYVAIDSRDNIIIKDGTRFRKYDTSGDLISTHDISSHDLGQCTDSRLGMLAVADSHRVVTFGKINREGARDIIIWDRKDIDRYGPMVSVVADGHRLVVLGQKGLCCYYIGPEYL